MTARIKNLHIERKTGLLAVALFSLLSTLLNGIIFASSGETIAQFRTLLKSDYGYSAYTIDTLGVDTYLIYDASISFSANSESDTCMNAAVIMQADSTEYSNQVFWNGDLLGPNSVAVSEGLAKKYNLQIGSPLYSKHYVDAQWREYRVEQILPDTTEVRSTKNRTLNGGIIIMGYDDQYAANISHNYIVFTDKNIDKISKVLPRDIVYRSDEIALVTQRLFPYIIILIGISILLSCLLVAFISKSAEKNYKRFILLGFDKKALNSAYYRCVCGIGILAVIVGLMLSSLLLNFCGICTLGFGILLLTAVVEMAAAILTARILNECMWRK